MIVIRLIDTVSVLGQDDGYKMKYSLLSVGVPKSKAQENSSYGQDIIVKNDYDNDSIISIIGNCAVHW